MLDPRGNPFVGETVLLRQLDERCRIDGLRCLRLGDCLARRTLGLDPKGSPSEVVCAALDGRLLTKHRSEGFAHPVKRWFSFLVNNTVWIDDVKIWKVK